MFFTDVHLYERCYGVRRDEADDRVEAGLLQAPAHVHGDHDVLLRDARRLGRAELHVALRRLEALRGPRPTWGGDEVTPNTKP